MVYKSEAFWLEYLQMIREGITAPLTVTGNSMSPYLIHLRDTVFLSPIREKPKRGDIVLYRRDNGAYILHRVYRVEKDTWTMVGDAQTVPETGLREEQLLAVVTSAERKGRREGPGSFWWEFFRVVWIRMVPLRPVCRKLYGIFAGQKKTEK